MNLKDFLASREKPPELYWSFVIEEGWVQAGIWYISDTEAEVVSISPPTSWEGDEELIGVSDTALSAAAQRMPEEYEEPTKTVFGVPSSWVKGGEIIESQIAKIKKICSELSLTPVGFVVIPEGIAHLYKSEEGAGLSGIIVGLSNENLEISVFKLGNLVGTTGVARSVSLVEDVVEGLSRFEGASPLPSRFIIYDGRDQEIAEAQDELLKASWEDFPKVKFLHTPKVETLTSDRKILAASLAGANEIGNVSKVLVKEEPQEEIAPEHDNLTEPDEETSADELGFVAGQDVGESQQPSQERPSPVQNEKRPKVNYLAKIKGFFANFKPKFPSLKFSGLPIFIVLGILFLGGVFLIWFYPKASVTIYVSPKTFQDEREITFDMQGGGDLVSGKIPATLISTEVQGDKTKDTTGTKLVGERAKGEVQVANGNAAPINLAKGTTLLSSGGLKFSIDEEASVSGQLLPGSPGTQNVKVTASDIGSDYNLAKGEIFSVGNFSKSLVAATSQSDFSGGSSQEISAVSKDDQSSLRTDLTNELLDKAKTDIEGNVQADQFLVEDNLQTETVSEIFDRKVGDEAQNLKLSLDLKVSAKVIDRNKLLEFAKLALGNEIPDGYVLRESQINFSFKSEGKVVISANFLPKTDIDEIKSKISGKSPEAAKNYLVNVPGFTRVEISLKPKLPGFLGTLPHVRDNIKVEIMAEK